MVERIVPHLDYLNFQLITPSPVLRPYIQQYWIIQHPGLAQASRPEFIHPSGGYGLVFNLGDSFWIDGAMGQGAIFLDGCNTVSRQLYFAGKVMALGIRFFPGKAYPFLQVPLHHLQNEVLLLDDIAQSSLMQALAEQIYTAPTLMAKINILETWLFNQLKHIEDASAVVPVSIQTLKKRHHELSIKQLADKLYLSQRQLERLYRKEVGFTPKQYTRLLRIEQARDHLKRQLHISTAQIGAELGFYDQPHFIREFRAVVGMTPVQYQQRQIDRLHADSDSSCNFPP